ncbi:HD domain-containing protein [Flavonifractor sp. An306]|uniref:HD domain-containing protein n=1 Tax=Flavonifractor sp. An306 TaxID=1965629 RepID=UPI001747F66A|nr:HD domain-containing protein [Flavonifractor sp. An306]
MAKTQKKIDEIIRLVMPPRAVEKLLDNQDVLFRYIPELLACRGFNQHNPYHVFDVLGHTLAAVDAAAEDPVVRMALLFHDVGKPISYQEGADGIRHFHGHGKISAEIAQRVLKRLDADAAFRSEVVRLVLLHDCFISADADSVKNLMLKVGLETFDRLLCVREADIKAQNPEFAKQRLNKLNALRAIKQQVC